MHFHRLKRKTDNWQDFTLTGYKPLAKFSVAPAYFFVLTHPAVWKNLFCFLHTVLKDFFFLQFSVLFGFKHVPIVQVDHPLDDAVPFKPEKITTYLDFINFWVRPLAFIVRRCKNERTELFCAFLERINCCYAEAATFYRYRMTTTKRPKGFFNVQYRIVQIIDPHFLCVPSLHVVVMVLAYSFFRKTLANAQFDEMERAFYLDELYHGALEIAETVLYVKQHSVNCIAAALYLMNNLYPEDFSIEDAIDFIDDLFVSASDIDAQKKDAINAHLHDLFEQLLLESANEYHWLAPLKRWITKYQ